MDGSTVSTVPTAFTDEIYKTLEEFDKLLFFRWDLTKDTVEITPQSAECPYALFPPAQNFSTYLMYSGLIYDNDRPLLEDYFNHIYSHQEKFQYGQDRTVRELRLQQADKEGYLWTEVKLLTFFQNSRPRMTFGLLRNIHTQKKNQLSLLHKAEHDALTGFYNKEAVKRQITDYLCVAERKPLPPALLIIDADGFKKINDTFGHLFGDAVLTDISMGIEKHFRHTDILGRIGGDEFLILLKEVPSMDMLTQKCQKFIDSFNRTYKNGNEDIPFSISVGIALYPQHGRTFMELFTHADRALYDAKSRGKGIYSIYQPSLLSQGSTISERDTIDSAEQQQKAFKDNMIEFVFRLFYETKNPSATISMSLGMLGKQFNFDRVAIDAFNKANNSYSNAYEWLSPFGFSRREHECQPEFAETGELCNRAILARYHATPFGMVSICNDTSTLEPAEAEAMKQVKVRAFAHCKIVRGSDELGCICFEDATGTHLYTQEELSALSIFAGMLGNILLTQQNDDALVLYNHRLADIIDHMQELICVIDKDTYELLFFNQTIRQALTESTAAQTCFYRFHKFDTPCPNCPVKDLSDNGAEYIVRTLDTWGCPASARAFNIEWEKNRRTSLVIMEPFTF